MQGRSKLHRHPHQHHPRREVSFDDTSDTFHLLNEDDDDEEDEIALLDTTNSSIAMSTCTPTSVHSAQRRSVSAAFHTPYSVHVI